MVVVSLVVVSSPVVSASMVSYSVLACDNVGTTTVTSKVAVTIPFSETLLPLRVIYLVKKRAQLKQAVAKMVTEPCTFLDKTPDKATMLKPFDTLRTVTAGKIYVENERAR